MVLKRIIFMMVFTIIMFSPALSWAVPSITTNYTVTSADSDINEMMLNKSTLGVGTVLSTLAVGAYSYDYVSIIGVADTTGSYRLGQSAAPVDTAMLLYTGVFDPNNPSVGAVAFDDDSGAGLLPEITYTLNTGDQYTIVITTYSPNASLALPMSFYSVGPGSLTFVVQRTATFQPVSGGNNEGAATILDELTGNVSGPMNTILNNMLSMSDADRGAALNRVIPETGRALALASSQASGAALDSVFSRLSNLRGGYTMKAFDMPNYYANSGSLSGLSGGNEVDQKNNRVWVQGFGYWGDQDEKDGYVGYKSNSVGLTIGADKKFFDELVTGLAFSYARTDVNMDEPKDGDGMDIKSYQLTAYSSYDFGYMWVDGSLAYTLHDYESTRDTTVSGVARGEFNGEQGTLRVNLGVPFHITDKVTLTPVVGGEFSHLEQQEYTERDAGPMGLSVDKSISERLRALAGLELQADIETSSDLVIVPSLKIGVAHDFNNDGIDSSARFIGGGGSFETEGQDLPENTYNMGLGLGLKFSAVYELNFNLNVEKADGYKSIGGYVESVWNY